MQKMLHFLESFTAQGSDGQPYKVCGYEHMVQNEALGDGLDHWEPTGVSEYRLEDGRRVDVGPDGNMVIVDTGVRLSA